MTNLPEKWISGRVQKMKDNSRYINPAYVEALEALTKELATAIVDAASAAEDFCGFCGEHECTNDCPTVSAESYLKGE